MTPTAWLIVAIISLIFSALFSGVEIAFISSDRVRVELDAQRGGLIGKLISRFYSDEDLFISTLLVGNNIVLVVYGMGAAAIIEPWLEVQFSSQAVVLLFSTLISTGVILITGEFLPKSIFRINPNLMFKIFSLPIFMFYIVLYPVSLFISALSKGIMKLFGIHAEAQRMGVLSVGDLNQFLETAIDEVNPDKAPVENEVKIFRKAIDFKDTQISECMIPRNEIVAVPLAGTTREKLIKVFTATGLSKVVVYREDIDDVAGYIHISEMFNSTADWRRKLKPVIFTPETMLANKMMRRMMSEKRTLAMVVDEFGGTSGLVTLEDIVEEIFGEIEDEHDVKRLVARELPDGAYEFSGRMEISAINEDFGLDIRESEEYHTLSGYILESLQALPRQGDSFKIGDLAFRIEKMTTTRIELVRIEKKKDA